jgi:hypothetical protein
VTLRAAPAKVVARYRKEIDQFRRMLGKLPGMASGMTQLVDAEVGLFLDLADQTDRFELSADAGDGAAWLELGLVPRTGTPLAEFDGLQRQGLDIGLLARLPPLEHASMVMAGHYRLGPARALVMRMVAGMTEQLAGAPLDEAQRKKWDALFDQFDGDMAARMGYAAGGALQMGELFTVTDGARTIALLKELFPVPAAGRKVSLLGMALTFSALADGPAHDGVATVELVVTPDYATLGPAGDAVRRAYGDALHVDFAGFDQTLAVALGSGGAERLAQMIDAARKGGGGPIEAGVRAAIGAAAARKAALVMVMDLAAAIAATVGASPPPSASGLAIELAFPDGSARMRFILPAAHVKELGAVMGR